MPDWAWLDPNSDLPRGKLLLHKAKILGDMITKAENPLSGNLMETSTGAMDPMALIGIARTTMDHPWERLWHPPVHDPWFPGRRKELEREPRHAEATMRQRNPELFSPSPEIKRKVIRSR